MRLTEQYKNRLKQLAGLKELDSKSPQHIALKKTTNKKYKPSQQPTGSIVGCTNPAAINYNPNATQPCKAGDADWYIMDDGYLYNDPATWFSNPISGQPIAAINYSNECCLYDCSNYEEWPGNNTAAWGPACGELWTQMYCEFGPAVSLSNGETYDWGGVQVANSYASMCEACASGNEGCPDDCYFFADTVQQYGVDEQTFCQKCSDGSWPPSISIHCDCCTSGELRWACSNDALVGGTYDPQTGASIGAETFGECVSSYNPDFPYSSQEECEAQSSCTP
jgi:hypothetical protein